MATVEDCVMKGRGKFIKRAHPQLVGESTFLSIQNGNCLDLPVSVCAENGSEDRAQLVHALAEQLKNFLGIGWGVIWQQLVIRSERGNWLRPLTIQPMRLIDLHAPKQ